MDRVKTEELTGAEIVVRCLQAEGVEVVFGYPGGAVLWIYDELFKQDKVRHVLVRHEQGAAHAADGYSRSSNKVGVCLVTSGPGVTNAVTGIATAYMDSIPIVVLTGQVPTHAIGGDAFQECDTVGITRPCTKHNYLVKSGDALARVIHEAFHVARSGRPGPVVVDLPKDILMGPAPYTPRDQVHHRTYNPKIDPPAEQVQQVVELMAKARRPIFYVGGGVINAGPEASARLTELVRATAATDENLEWALDLEADRMALGDLQAEAVLARREGPAQRRVGGDHGLERLAQACRVEARAHRRRVGDRVVAVGDAAGLVKPTTGGGIYYGLKAASGECSFVTSCDAAFINLSLISYLVSRISNCDVVVPYWNERLQPLQAVYRKGVLPLLKEQLDRGELRPIFLYDKVRTDKVGEGEIRRFDPEGLSFLNMNTPADYEAVLKRWRQEREPRSSDGAAR